MTKKIKFKTVKTTVDSNQYITNINEIADEINDLTLKVSIIDIKKWEFKNEIIVGLKLKDNSGLIPALLVGNNDDEFKHIIQKLVINKVYLIKGSSIILRENNENEDNMIKNKINEIIKVNDMFVAITAIKL